MFILINTWIYNQTGGTGGALFRTMYSQFLGETYEIIDNNFLKRVKEICTDVSEAWNKVAQYLLPDDLPAIKEIKNIFREINKIQEESRPQYRKKLAELDKKWISLKYGTVEKTKKYFIYIPYLQEAIQQAYDFGVEGIKILDQL